MFSSNSPIIDNMLLTHNLNDHIAFKNAQNAVIELSCMPNGISGGKPW